MPDLLTADIPTASSIAGLAFPDPARVAAMGETIAGGPGYGLRPVGRTIAVLSRLADESQRRYGDRVWELVDRDPAAGGSVDLLCYATIANEMRILPAVQPRPGRPPDDPAAAAEAQAAADLCGYCLSRLEHPIGPVLRDLVGSALRFGASLAELVWEVPSDGLRAGSLLIKAVKPKARQNWSFVVNAFFDVLGILSATPDLAGVQVVPRSKFAGLTWAGKGCDPRGESIYVRAVEPWNFRVQMPAEHFRFVQRFGSPTALYKVSERAASRPYLNPDGTPNRTLAEQSPEQAALLVAQQVRNGQAAAIPAEDDIALLESKGDGRVFDLAMDIYRREIVAAILLTARATMDSDRNSKADHTGSLDVLGTLVLFLRRWVVRMIEWEIFHPIIAYNFGPDVAARSTPRASLGDVEQRDLTTLLGGLAAIGYTLEPGQFPEVDAALAGLVPLRDPAADPSADVGVAKAPGSDSDPDTKDAPASGAGTGAAKDEPKR